MNKNKSFLIIFLLSLTLASSASSQDAPSQETSLLSANLRVLNQYHFLEKSLDEDLFSEIFDNYLKEVDQYKIFLTQAQVDELEGWKIPQDTLESVGIITAYTEEFANENVQKIRNASERLFRRNFDFSRQESYNNDYENLSFATNDAELIERWRSRLKYQVLTRTLEKILPDTNFTRAANTAYQNRNADDEEDDITPQSYQTALSESVEEIKNNTLRLLSTIETLKRRDYLNSYVNAIGRTYDEYTSYLPPVQKETFDIRLSGQLEGIGAEIRKASDGLVEIVRLVPGGASYRQKELEAGDKIIKVAQSDGEPVDIQNTSLDEALKLIRGKKGTLVRLTVKKKTGTIVVIPIVRDKVILEETYARSAILNKNNQRYGYIYLPKFYRDFEDSHQRTATDDVRKELLSLNNQDVQGLIFDVRNNGGGSLEDAILMSGLFITEGPIIRVRDRDREYPAYTDKDPGIVFTQPMIVLVNGGSASASEIFAAALQDYKRAVVVGSGEKTFGKGTVQTLFALNRIPQAASFGEDPGYLKFTIQKYYRITGQSTQTLGVQPDIILPSLAPSFKQESAFTNDTLKPIVFNKWQAYQYALDDLARRSSQRVKQDRIFQNIEKRNTFISKNQEQTTFPLQYKKAFAQRQSYLNTLIKNKVDLNRKLDFNVIALPSTQDESKQTEFSENKIEKNQWYEGLSKDIYIREAMNVLTDIIQT